jgi:acyl carrier protein
MDEEMDDAKTKVSDRIREIVAARYGRVEERLLASGLLDSLSAVELALELEKEFDLEADSFALSDMASITALSERILAARGA